MSGCSSVSQTAKMKMASMTDPSRITRYVLIAALALVAIHGSATILYSGSGAETATVIMPHNQAIESIFKHVPAPKDRLLWSRVGKVTMLYYDKVNEASVAYENGLLSHKDHNERFGYPHYVLRAPIVTEINGERSMWSKEAYLFQLLTEELAKPTEQRLEWLFWHDADIVMLNDHLSLETFLPPPHLKAFENVSMLTTNDLNGLNDGTFFLRVNQWSLGLMAAAYAWLSYHPEAHGLPYGEQSALEALVVPGAYWHEGVVHFPQRWINAYHHFGLDPTVPPEWEFQMGYVEKGDLLVHLPGTGEGRKGLMNEWVERMRDHRDEWSSPELAAEQTDMLKKFWYSDDGAKMENETQVDWWRRWHLLQEVGREEDDKRRAKEWEVTNEMNKQAKSKDETEKAVDVVRKEYWKYKMQRLREAEVEWKKEHKGEYGRDKFKRRRR